MNHGLNLLKSHNMKIQHCNSNRVASANDLDPEGNQGFVYPSICSCTFAKFYSGATREKEVIEHWASRDVGSSVFPRECPPGPRQFACAKNKFLITCQEMLMQERMEKLKACQPESSLALIQNQTSADTERSDGSDLIISLLADSESSRSKAHAGWNCG
jgi:hypothetical protein